MSELSKDIENSFRELLQSSDAKEEVEEAVEKIMEHHREHHHHEGDVAMMMMGVPPGDWENVVPSWTDFQEHYDKWSINVLRQAARWFAGKEPWATGEDAYNDVSKQFGGVFYDLVLNSFADGVQIGHEVSHLVKKKTFFNAQGELFKNKKFREDSGLLAITILGDEDANKTIRTYYEGAFEAALRGLSFREIENNTIVDRKVYDVFGMVIAGLSKPLFLTGFYTGKKWKERDTLSGILAASEETDE